MSKMAGEASGPQPFESDDEQEAFGLDQPSATVRRGLLHRERHREQKAHPTPAYHIGQSPPESIGRTTNTAESGSAPSSQRNTPLCARRLFPDSPALPILAPSLRIQVEPDCVPTLMDSIDHHEVKHLQLDDDASVDSSAYYHLMPLPSPSDAILSQGSSAGQLQLLSHSYVMSPPFGALTGPSTTEHSDFQWNIGQGFSSASLTLGLSPVRPGSAASAAQNSAATLDFAELAHPDVAEQGRSRVRHLTRQRSESEIDTTHYASTAPSVRQHRKRAVSY